MLLGKTSLISRHGLLSSVIVLLAGGSKRGQDRDIARAKRYWIDCKGLK